MLRFRAREELFAMSLLAAVSLELLTLLILMVALFLFMQLWWWVLLLTFLCATSELILFRSRAVSVAVVLRCLVSIVPAWRVLQSVPMGEQSVVISVIIIIMMT